MHCAGLQGYPNDVPGRTLDELKEAAKQQAAIAA
eukprot:SAG11_NODE_35675_length_265_cov_1.210843_1_plen_33_part_10